MTYSIVALATCQFSWGGLFDSVVADHRIHLVRMAARGGTPGPTLCDLDRFGGDTPGFNIGGGVSDPEARPCTDCVEVADDVYPEQPIWGGSFRHVFPDRAAAPWDARHLPGVDWEPEPGTRGIVAIQPHVTVNQREA